MNKLVSVFLLSAI